MANIKEDITVFASDNDDVLTLKQLKAATCRFSVAIIVLKSDDKDTWIDRMPIESIDKAVIIYKLPVNIELARTMRDKLVKAGVSEIKDCFYDKNLGEGIMNYINSWNDCPAEEDEKIKIGKYIKRRAKATKDAPINLYASAMIGEMGELLLKLNKLANTFANVMLSYFQQEGTGIEVDEDSSYDFGSASGERPKPKEKKIPHQKENKAKPEDIPSWKSQIENALASRNGNVWLPSENTPRLPKILLIGDSGVGKSLVANYIHETVLHKLRENNILGSEDKSRPARIGIPEFEKKEDDLEYSLFGYAPGAYTGANENGNPGLLLDNICQVVFLDEIGAATPSIQNKLLTYLDDYKVRPRGMNDDIFCPTLVVAATNEWKKLTDPKIFRSDLLARFTDRLGIPNIKKRIKGKEENLLYLLDCILQVEDINPEPKVESIGKGAFKALFDHFSNGCTGNFRELENLMREACEQARKDKRNYMVEQDVKQAIDNLNKSLANSQEESSQASVSADNAASGKPAPQTEMEPSPARTEETDDRKQGITADEKEMFWEKCGIMKKNDDVRKQILEAILRDNTKGYSQIIKSLPTPEGGFPKGFPSAVQRLTTAIRKYFRLPSCREARRRFYKDT